MLKWIKESLFLVFIFLVSKEVAGQQYLDPEMLDKLYHEEWHQYHSTHGECKKDISFLNSLDDTITYGAFGITLKEYGILMNVVKRLTSRDMALIIDFSKGDSFENESYTLGNFLFLKYRHEMLEKERFLQVRDRKLNNLQKEARDLSLDIRGSISPSYPYHHKRIRRERKYLLNLSRGQLELLVLGSTIYTLLSSIRGSTKK